jgi:hypothetical protein
MKNHNFKFKIYRGNRYIIDFLFLSVNFEFFTFNF